MCTQFLCTQRLQRLPITSLIYEPCCYEIVTLRIVSVVFTQTRRSKLSWKKKRVTFLQWFTCKGRLMRKTKFSCGPRAGKNKEGKPPSPLPKTNIHQNTVVTANLSGKRAYVTSECNLTSDGIKLLSCPSLQAVGKSVMPPTGWFLL